MGAQVLIEAKIVEVTPRMLIGAGLIGQNSVTVLCVGMWR